jgi:hypothetical protein
MTSILKVNQIQNTAGGVPTAADLGLNVAGSVIQAVNVTANAVTISAASPTTIVTTNITTQANSKLYIAFSSDLNADAAGAWKYNQMYLDNVLQTGNISSTSAAGFQSCISLVHLSSAVTAGTHTVKITGHSGAGTSTYAEGGMNGNSLVVMEIAG